MKRGKHNLLMGILVITTAFALGFISGKHDGPFDMDDVWHAQHLVGVEFTQQEIDTMLTYLERNLDGYDTMRTMSLDNEVFPAILFDPTPNDFKLEEVDQIEIEWGIPSDESLPENQEELAFYSLGQLASLLQSRQITSVALTELYLSRIKQYDSLLSAVISITEDLAYAQARKADEEIAGGLYRGPLHGIPYGVKDLMAVPGYPTTWGAMPYREQQIDYTAAVVAQLEAAGAVLIAKLTSGALARGDVWFGGQTKNPWDLEQGASGSSAGSGSATAAGLVAFSIGTETLGSIVSPSTRSGITGLRPTYGRVSRYGTMSLSWSMDKIGPICRSAKDCALVFDAIRGADSRDETLIPAPFNYQGAIDWANLKVGYLEHQFESDTTENSANNKATLKSLKKMGADLIPVAVPEGVPYDVFDIILRAEAGAFFEELVRTKGDSNMVQQDKRSRANSLRQSRFIPAVEYLQANRHRRVLIEKMAEIFERIDVLVSPTFGGEQLLITNLTGHPSIAVPNGFNSDNHPTSFTIVGKLFDEATILGLAETYQANTDYHERHPPLFTTPN